MTRSTLLSLALCAAAALPAAADDWPAFRADAARSGYTKEPVPNQLNLRWVYRSRHAPRPAWPTVGRMEFDHAAQPIVMGHTVVFGSSADDRVIAIDARTGTVRWEFFTEGPVRFAPAGWKDRVFVASDDGHLVALSLADGRLLWKVRGGPDDGKVIGNGRIISRWPARGGPVVFDGTVYFAAGIWPSDRIYFHAIDAATGASRWVNSKTGRMAMDQPHSNARAASGVAPQGYLLASKTSLFAPTGRAVPAAFRRSDGEFLYYHLQENRARGGTRVVLADRFLVNSGCLFDQETGKLAGRVGLGPSVATPNGMVRAEGKALLSYRWIDARKFDRKGKPYPVRMLDLSRQVRRDREVLSLLVAGGDAICGEAGRVSGCDYTRQRSTWWSHEIEGTALGLAYGNGHLVVSTDAGVLYGFDGAPEAAPVLLKPATEGAFSPPHRETAREIVEKTGVNEGFCVVLGAGGLEMELARRTNLRIVAVEPEAKRAARARKRLEAAGLYGVRVAVLQADPARTPLPPRFADLVVSSRGDAPEEEMRRLQRPHGGILYAGGKVNRRGAVEGAGSWTHQNSDAGNTLCSNDEVKGPLEMFWFRDMEFEIPNRHGQGPAPLYHRGVMVVGGVDGLCGVDAYNGRRLWTCELPRFLADYDGIHHDVGTGDTGGPFCLGGGSAYARVGDRCVRIDLKTGKKLGEFRTPVEEGAKSRAWGYLAYSDGLLFGSVANAEHTVSPRYRHSRLRTESVLFFAIDPDTGEVKWNYRPNHSIRHNAIAVAGGRVYLIDRVLAMEDRITDPKRDGKHRPRLKPGEHAGGTLLALDARTGKPVWKQDEDVFGTQIAVSEKHGILLMTYQAVRHRFFRLPSEVGDRIAGIDAKTGVRLWDRKAKHVTRPVINDAVVYAQGGAWDLRSGSDVPFKFQRSYGCGQISSGANLMLFRSATLGVHDLSREAGTENWGGIRPSCWINAIPAGGLVLVPEGSSKCVCSYQMKAWFALKEKE